MEMEQHPYNSEQVKEAAKESLGYHFLFFDVDTTFEQVEAAVAEKFDLDALKKELEEYEAPPRHRHVDLDARPSWNGKVHKTCDGKMLFCLVAEKAKPAKKPSVVQKAVKKVAKKVSKKKPS